MANIWTCQVPPLHLTLYLIIKLCKDAPFNAENLTNVELNWLKVQNIVFLVGLSGVKPQPKEKLLTYYFLFGFILVFSGSCYIEN